jgi:hypothetical protein
VITIRLAVGDRQARIRLVLLAVGIATAVAAATVVVGGLRATSLASGRADWLQEPVATLVAAPGNRPAGPFTYWLSGGLETPAGQVTTITVALHDGGVAPPDGLPRYPAPGTAYASPALAAFLRTVEGRPYRYQLPDRIVGLLRPALVPRPSAMVIVRGLVAVPGGPLRAASLVTDFARATGVTDHPRPGGGLWDAVSALLMAWSLLIVALLFTPVGLLLAAASRVAATTREDRLGAVRLAGASTRDLKRIATVEAATGSTIGAIVGLAIAFAAIHRGGDPEFLSYWVADISPGRSVAAALLAVPTCVAVASARAGAERSARRIEAGGRPAPLPVPRSRGATATFVVLGAVVIAGGAVARVGAVIVFLGTPLLGLIVAEHGPRIARTVGRRLAAGGGAARVLAGARLLHDPVRAYRTVRSVAVAAAIISTVAALVATSDRGARPAAAASGLVAVSADGARLARLPGVVATIGAVECSRIAGAVREPTWDLCPPEGVLLRTDGSRTALARIRTAAWSRNRDTGVFVPGEHAASTAAPSGSLLALGTVAVLLTIVAIAAVLIALLDGIGERRRSSSTLLALGIPRAVVARAEVIAFLAPLAALTGALLLGGGVLAALTLLVNRQGVASPASVVAALLVPALLVAAAAAGAVGLGVRRGVKTAEPLPRVE